MMVLLWFLTLAALVLGVAWLMRRLWLWSALLHGLEIPDPEADEEARSRWARLQACHSCGAMVCSMVWAAATWRPRAASLRRRSADSSRRRSSRIHSRGRLAKDPAPSACRRAYSTEAEPTQGTPRAAYSSGLSQDLARLKAVSASGAMPMSSSAMARA